MPAAAVAAAVVMAAVDNDNGIEWRWWGGAFNSAAVFDGNGDGLQLSNGKAKMAIDTSSGGF